MVQISMVQNQKIFNWLLCKSKRKKKKINWVKFRILCRTHLSKGLAEISPVTGDSCDRRSSSPANLAHAFWSYPQLENYWAAGLWTITRLLGMTLKPCQLIAVFGVVDENLGLNEKQSDMIAFTWLLWENMAGLEICHSVWLWKTWCFFLKLEKITFTLKVFTIFFFF